MRDQYAINAAKTRYNEKNYDQIKLYGRKGSREIIQRLAAAAGLSMAEYIRHCIIKDAEGRGIDVREALGGGGLTSTIAAIIASCDLPEQISGDWRR